jgi:pimeloyl-ACP methyl ester carboxylesterase
MSPPKPVNLRTIFFNVPLPAPTHPDSIHIELDDPNRGTIQLAAQLDIRSSPPQKGIAIVLHGMLDNRHKPLVSHLRDYLPFNVCTMDFRGMGESGGETTFWSHGREADECKALVDVLERDYAEYGPILVVMGHSKVRSRFEVLGPKPTGLDADSAQFNHFLLS